MSATFILKDASSVMSDLFGTDSILRVVLFRCPACPDSTTEPLQHYLRIEITGCPNNLILA